MEGLSGLPGKPGYQGPRGFKGTVGQPGPIGFDGLPGDEIDLNFENQLYKDCLKIASKIPACINQQPNW